MGDEMRDQLLAAQAFRDPVLRSRHGHLQPERALSARRLVAPGDAYRSFPETVGQVRDCDG